MFQVFTKGWSLKAVIFFNGYLWLHSILWDLCIPALSHPVPQKKTCSAAIKAAYLHRSTCSAVYYKRHSLSSSTFWVLNTIFLILFLQWVTAQREQLSCVLKTETQNPEATAENCSQPKRVLSLLQDPPLISDRVTILTRPEQAFCTN